ncbi:hypothetical protein B0H13DRAFT_2261477 [Mycena leptocephala]|nr:hypothetical protein B0H13DRAFT_2261477 [Mycena leptocephala]
MSSLFGRLPAPMRLALFSLLFAGSALADPASIPFEDCFSGNDSMKLTVDEVYGQVLTSSELGTYLNLTVIGNSPQDILGFTDSSSSLATLFTTTSVLTLNVWTNSTYLCTSLRPPSPLTPLNDTSPNYCPLPAGQFALSSAIPWGPNRPLTTLNTRLRAVDPFSKELLCLNVNTTPLDPGSQSQSPYGVASTIFWATVSLAILYWLVIGLARIVSAWGRGITRPGRSLWARAQSAGFIVASAISGERFATSPALMRFSTPCLRDVLFHTQWCAALAMVAVQWPPFAYPLLVQTAWATLSYNITLTQNPHWNPLSTPPFNPPSGFSAQLADPTSPIYINPQTPNLLFTLPTNATAGMSMFAYTLGLITGAAAIAHYPRHARARSPGPKELETAANTDETKSAIFRPASRLTLSGPGGGSGGGGNNSGVTSRPWYRVRTEISSFHWSVLHGNLVRILVLFHLPLTIFASYEMTLPASAASVKARALAGLSFAVLSVIVPAALVLRVSMTTTNKLYDETRTLLALGPLYNHYRAGSQLFASLLFLANLVCGVVIGVGQKSGTAQAVVILVVEVAAALVTSVWLPWGSGASMGLISFLFCVARIVVAVLLVILTPAISIGDGSGAWVAYGILVILALVYLALVLMLLIKLIEAAVRIVGRVGFDRSTHTVDSGLLGACGLLGCCGSRKRRPRHRARSHKHPRGGYAQPAASGRASDASSNYAPPNALAGLDSSSKKGSIHSQQPPSVLRPEHALRPYREDSDDENGYIMGAWQPFPRPGYVPSRTRFRRRRRRQRQHRPPRRARGSRVWGRARAHRHAVRCDHAGGVDADAGMACDGRGAGGGRGAACVDGREAAEPRDGAGARGGSERGAAWRDAAAHAHQVADGDHRGRADACVAPPSRAKVLQQQQQQQADDDDDDESAEAGQQRRKKPWYHIRRHRPHSEGTPPPSAYPPQASADAQQAAAATGDVPAGRSFVVIRKPQASPARSQQLSTASTPTPTHSSFRGAMAPGMRARRVRRRRVLSSFGGMDWMYSARRGLVS